MIRRIAGDEGMPEIHLGKVLQQFVRAGLLKSSKGPTGGFALRRSATEIRLIDIVTQTDGVLEYQRCALGLAECSNDLPCSIHDKWTVLRSRILEYLEKNTVADLAKALKTKRISLRTVANKPTPKKAKSRSGKEAKRLGVLPGD